MPKDVTVFLVTHDYATDIRTGGGQRTMMFFEAAKKVAQTEVVILGISPRHELTRLFPGAAAVHYLTEKGFAPRAPTRVGRMVETVRRLVMIRRHFAPDPQLSREVAEIATRPGLNVLLVRYAYPFFKMGLANAPSAGRLVAVDLDDLDDKKYATESTRRFGRLFTRLVMTPLVLTPLYRMLSQGLARATTTWVCTTDDAHSYPGITSQIVPNVPFDQLGSNTPAPPFPKPSAARDVLFLASTRHIPNQRGIEWFLQNCWPTLADRFPDACLRIVGHGDWAFLKDRFGHLDRVHFGGTVTDVAAEYARARVAISPVALGAGTKIKVVEACAFGRPIVVTPHSARGFETPFAGHMAVADSPADFTEACARFLSDPALADRTGAALQAIQTAHFSFDAAVARIVADLHSMVETPGETPSKVTA